MLIMLSELNFFDESAIYYYFESRLGKSDMLIMLSELNFFDESAIN